MTRDSGATFLRHLAGEPPGDPDSNVLKPISLSKGFEGSSYTFDLFILIFVYGN